MTTKSGKAPTLRQRIQRNKGQIYFVIQGRKGAYYIRAQSKQQVIGFIRDCESLGEEISISTRLTGHGSELLYLSV